MTKKHLVIAWILGKQKQREGHAEKQFPTGQRRMRLGTCCVFLMVSLPVPTGGFCHLFRLELHSITRCSSRKSRQNTFTIMHGVNSLNDIET